MSSQPNHKVPTTRIAYAVSVALTGNYAPAVLAQSQTADLEAVIVTARKREETLLDIPQEIQAISQEQLERANLDSVEDFSRFVPSLSYNAVTPGRGSIYFRGVADDSSSFIADASSAIYLDEQPLTQSALQPEDPPRRHRAHRGAARPAGHALRLELAVRDAALHHQQAGPRRRTTPTSAWTAIRSRTATRDTKSPAC